MSVLIGMVLTLCMMIFSISQSISIIYPLLVSFILFLIIFLFKGFNFKDLIKMAWKGGKKTLIVLEIFVLIGSLMSLWMSSGTISTIVFYGLKYSIPNLFILSAFVISAFVSLLIGTAFGTVGTIGLSLMILGKTGGINLDILGAAVICGAFFGDRASPMSSSANLVATLTNTNLLDNIKRLFKTSNFATFITLIFFLILSFLYPLSNQNSNLLNILEKSYNINIINFIPAFLIIILSLFKVNVKLSMLLSALSAFIISIFVQKLNFFDIINYTVLGYTAPFNNEISKIIHGGGIISMVNVSIIVFVSSTLAGLFEGTKALESIEKSLIKLESRSHTFLSMIIISVISAAFGCTQVMAIIMTEQITKTLYRKNKLTSQDLAMDIEDSAVVISPLIPWNLASLFPVTTLGITYLYLPYAIYLYILPLTRYIYYMRKERSLKIL